MEAEIAARGRASEEGDAATNPAAAGTLAADAVTSVRPAAPLHGAPAFRLCTATVGLAPMDFTDVAHHYGPTPRLRRGPLIRQKPLAFVAFSPLLASLSSLENRRRPPYVSPEQPPES